MELKAISLNADTLQTLNAHQVLSYGKLNVFEPVISFTPYYLKYCEYCSLVESYKSLLRKDATNGMYWDCCNPMNDKYKYQLSKYKQSTLQQLNHELRSIYFMFNGPFIQFVSKNPKSKQVLIESCWKLMKKLKKRNHFLSKIKLVENGKYVSWNESVIQMFQM